MSIYVVETQKDLFLSVSEAFPFNVMIVTFRKADILFEDLINPIGPQMHISIANSNYNNEIGKEVEAAAGKIKSKGEMCSMFIVHSRDGTFIIYSIC